MAGSSRWRQVAATLADADRRLLYARIVVADAEGRALTAGDLDSAGARRLRALTSAGLIAAEQDVLRPSEIFAELLREDPPRAAEGPERFLAGGRLTGLPRRARDRAELFGWLAGRVLAAGECLDEKQLTSRLAEVAVDPVALRRYLVDAGCLLRSPDGRDYRLPEPSMIEPWSLVERVETSFTEHGTGLDKLDRR